MWLLPVSCNKKQYGLITSERGMLNSLSHVVPTDMPECIVIHGWVTATGTRDISCLLCDLLDVMERNGWRYAPNWVPSGVSTFELISELQLIFFLFASPSCTPVFALIFGSLFPPFFVVRRHGLLTRDWGFKTRFRDATVVCVEPRRQYIIRLPIGHAVIGCTRKRNVLNTVGILQTYLLIHSL